MLTLFVLYCKSRATTKKRYNDTAIQEPEPGTVHNLCKLEHISPQEIYMIIIYRGGGAQFKDSIKYYMQSIYFDFFSQQNKK